jgi:hypothetical protein
MIYYCHRKATALQKIQFVVAKGATHHTEMQIPPKSIESVVKKMTVRYELDLSKIKNTNGKNKVSLSLIS